ncbi:MAG: ATP-binding protein [Nitrospiraceae bacterium]|nr:MAG: ATP-binding protein [Nitrospiraceae bacterium]
MISEGPKNIPRIVVYGSKGFDELISRFRTYTGKSFTVLFSGPAGTCKPLAADIIAAELGLGVFRVDLSSVVNKYIGETEKNLDRVFREASAGGAILFFDEADALFGKRAEVADTHDRYANLEIKYLLQKIEKYDGIVVLATNHNRNIDEAFIRKMRFVVEFPLEKRK